MSILSTDCPADEQGDESRGSGRLIERRLADLPDELGFAGPIAGVSNGALLLGGGTNFPVKMPWEDGTKSWHDDLFVLPGPDAEWATGFKLPRPVAYAAAVTTERGVIYAGGSDGVSAVADVVLLTWRGGRVVCKRLSDLPQPISGACAAVLGGRMYLAGGHDGVEVLENPSRRTFWSLDLSRDDAKWQELAPWPGAARFYAIAAADADSFYVISGMRQTADGGAPALQYLTDGYRYAPARRKWTRIAELPVAHAAAPSPAATLPGDRFAIIGGGVDARDVQGPMREQTGLRRTVICYDRGADRWDYVSEIAQSCLTVPLVPWQGGFIVAGGEIRAGVRSRQTWSYHFAAKETK